MHGGAPGSGGPKGSHNGNYKHGQYTAEAIASRRWLRQYISDARALVSQGQNMVDGIRQIGVSEVTYYRWRQEFGGLKTEQVKRLKDLELENSRRRKAVSDLTNAAANDVLDCLCLLPGDRRAGELAHDALGRRHLGEPEIVLFRANGFVASNDAVIGYRVHSASMRPGQKPAVPEFTFRACK